MAQSDTRNFLVDLFARYDPELDLSSGSRAMTELVEPILERIGPDPFDDDIETFVRTRIRQVRPDLATTEADELNDLILNPMRVLIEPLSREINLIKLRTRLDNVASLSDEEIDALMANFFEARRSGGFSVGTVRAYFAAPQNVNVTLVQTAHSRGGLRFIVPRPQSITAEQMLLNVEGSEYYFDINYIAENGGSEYNIEAGEIVSISNLPSATRVRNLRRFRGGVAREDSEAFVARVQQGTSDKTLTTAPGIVAVLHDNFPTLRQLLEVGHGDAEMQRDVVRGGGLGPVPDDDSLGHFYGTGQPVDDLDADATTNVLEAATGHFVSRLGAVGTEPRGWYVSLIYTSGSLVVKDVAVLGVVSDTRIRIDAELPLTLGAGSVVWALREKKITLSDIPGGVTFPDSVDGSLELRSDEVHIGGKTDVYIAGSVDEASAQIASLTDELPVARGIAAQTQGSSSGNEDIVLLTDITAERFALVEAGMSLVLSEGVDTGAYRILQVMSGPYRVRVYGTMSGTQSNLTWKIVDDIDVDLVEPKDILLEGSDLLLSAGSDVVTVSGSTNFLDSGARAGDVLFVDNEEYGGDFTIVEVNPASLKISPAAPRTLAGVHYVLSRRFEGVQRPVVRIKSLELLDSAGAPNGTRIPYRDPVLVSSNAFQNEGTGYLFDAPALIGLVSAGHVSYPSITAGMTLTWSAYDADKVWAGAVASGTIILSGDPLTFQGLADELNGDAGFAARARAVALSYGGRGYLGIASNYHFRLTAGTALSPLGITAGMSNCQIRVVSGLSLTNLKVRRGDLIECVDGSNAGVGARVLSDPGTGGYVVVGSGPLGPPSTTALYDNTPLNPDAGGRVRIARPSVGSVRAYYLDPTSAEFDYRTTRFRYTTQGQELVYRPDPENTRVLVPPVPSTILPNTATFDGSALELTDTEANFLSMGIRAGDLLEILYRPIVGTEVLSGVGNLAVGGLTLVLRIAQNSFIQISFPYAMTRTDTVDYINEQVGTEIASIDDTGHLVLKSSQRLELSASSTALTLFGITDLTTDHPNQGLYIIREVTATVLQISSSTPASGISTSETHYRIQRYLQRISSTEMNLQQDVSGLYYADVEAVALLPGDRHNIATGLELSVEGHRGDGYRLVCERPELSFSRVEDLRAEVSRTVLLVGAADSPEEYVQLNLQGVQVSYERSSLVDEVQSFCSSRYRRVLNQDILVRHLLPHYVSLNWSYAGGVSEAAMARALIEALDAIEGGAPLEVGKLTDVVRRNQATSVYTPDATRSSGRTAPLILVVSHDTTRKIRGALVRDLVETVRTQRYIPDQLVLRRLSSSGLR